MTDALRRAAGISPDAPRFRKGVTETEVNRHTWHRSCNTGALELTYAELEERGGIPDGVEDWVQAWSDGQESRGLLLSGPPGTGKTTLAKAIAHEVIDRSTSKRMGRTPEVIPAWPVYYVAYSHLIRDVGRRMALEQRHLYDEEYDHLDLYLASVLAESDRPKWVVRLAVLDDVGKEYRGKLGADSWAAGYINQIMRARHDFGLTTLVTSNHALSEWDGVYGQAAGSFAHQAFYEVLMTGSDRRR